MSVLCSGYGARTCDRENERRPKIPYDSRHICSKIIPQQYYFLWFLDEVKRIDERVSFDTDIQITSQPFHKIITI